MPDIALLLLGNPELHVRNRRIDVGVKRLAALAYLALNGTTRRRTLAELLWPDSDNPLNNLAVARNDLSRILGADGLEVDAQTIGLGPAVRVDLQRWRTGTGQRDPEAWGLYRGAFLEGLRLNDWANGLGEEFETWLLETRETLALEQREFAHHLGLEALRESDFERAQGFLKVAHGLAHGLAGNPNEEPREDATGWYILTLGAIGQHDAAMTAFANLRQRLLEELEVEPNAQTRRALEFARTNPEACRAQITQILDTQRLNTQRLNTQRLDTQRLNTQRLDTQRLNTQRANKPRHETHREQTPLVGRETQLRELEAQLLNAPSGFTLFVRGESGVGKTRLLQTLQERNGGKHQIFKLEFVAGQAPLSPLERAVRQLVTAQAAQAERLPILWKIALGRFVPNLLPNLLPTEAPPGEPELERIAAFSAIRALLEGLGPTWLHLEDLQWADRQSLELVQYLRSNPPESGLLQTLTWRDTQTRETPGNEHLNSAIQSWMRDAHASLHLRGLEEAAIQELAQWFERPEVDPHELRQRTNGNPLYVTEWLRTQNAQARIGQTRPEQSKLEQSKLEQAQITLNPSDQSLHNLIRARIEDLGPDARQTLEALAITGANTSLALLQRTSGRSLEQTSSDLETASQAQLIQHDTNGIRFNHDLTLEVIQNDLGSARLSLLHLRAARATHATPLTSAQHYWQARDALSEDDASKSYNTYIEAGTQLGLRGEISDAMTWYERALEHAQNPNERVRVMTNQARTLERFAHYDEASRLLERIEPLLEMVEPVTAATAMNVRGEIMKDRYGDVTLGLECGNAALNILDGVASSAAQLERGRANHLLGWCAWQNRDYNGAEKWFRVAMVLHESMGNQADLASSMIGLGVSRMYAQKDDVKKDDAKKDDVKTLLQEAIGLAKKSNNQSAYAHGLNYLGNYYRRVKDWENAILSFQAAIETRSDLGEDYIDGMWLNNLAITYFELGKLELARKNYKISLKSRDVTENTRYLRILVLGNLAEVDLRLKHFHEARETLNEAVSLIGGDSTSTLCADIYFWLGELEVLENKLSSAEVAYETALDIAETCNYPDRCQTSISRLVRLARNTKFVEKLKSIPMTHGSRAASLFAAGRYESSKIEMANLGDRFENIRLELDIARATGDQKLEQETLNLLPL